MVSVAVDGSTDEFAEFINRHDLGSLTAITDETHPELVTSMLSEHGVTGKPSFVAIRASGEYTTSVGWSSRSLDRTVRWLER